MRKRINWLIETCTKLKWEERKRKGIDRLIEVISELQISDWRRKRINKLIKHASKSKMSDGEGRELTDWLKRQSVPNVRWVREGGRKLIELLKPSFLVRMASKSLVVDMFSSISRQVMEEGRWSRDWLKKGPRWRQVIVLGREFNGWLNLPPKVRCIRWWKCDIWNWFVEMISQNQMCNRRGRRGSE